jgi:hypothetical protein
VELGIDYFTSVLPPAAHDPLGEPGHDPDERKGGRLTEAEDTAGPADVE